MNKFLERQTLTKLTQEGILQVDLCLLENIDYLIKNLLLTRPTGPDGFTSEFYQIFKVNILQYMTSYRKGNTSQLIL